MLRLRPFVRKAAKLVLAGSVIAGSAHLYFEHIDYFQPTERQRKENVTHSAPVWLPRFLTRAETSSSTPNPSSSTTSQPGLFWVPPSREEQINALKKGGEFDLLIVGGGATGAGIALDAAGRGLKVAMVERDDFASGTSSRSTKLIHGGVRYLEKAIKNLDVEQYNLVKEALHERANLIKIAPHLATQIPFMLPIYKWYLVPYYWVGSKLYDALAGKAGLESSYFLTRSKALDSFPMLKSERLVGAMVYYDGQHNDSRMNVTLALTAASLGAVIANHVEVIELLKAPSPEGGVPQISGAVLKDNLTGETWKVPAKGVINATGPFTDSLRKMANPDAQTIVQPSSGVHIVLPDYYSPENMGLLDPATSDGRVIFFLPWEKHTIAGTTDAPTAVTAEPLPKEEEIQFILKEVKGYLNSDVKVRRGDVLAAWSGIRPLVRDPNAKSTEGLSRNHVVHVSEEGLVTIAGGKWTTYRAMAKDAVDKAIEAFKLQPASGCRTEDILLVGAHNYSKTTYIRLVQQFGIEPAVAKHLATSYGDRAYTVASLATPTGKRWPVVGKRLVDGYPYIEAEVVYAVRHEYAATAVDFLARRSRLAFLNAGSALDALPRVVELMSRELSWSAKRRTEEINRARAFLTTMGLDSPEGQSDFNAQELIRFREAFQSMDINGDGKVSAADLDKVLRQMGVHLHDEKEVQRVIDEVDANRNGTVEFSDFLEVMSAIKSGKRASKSRFARYVAEVDRLTQLGNVATDRSGGGV